MVYQKHWVKNWYPINTCQVKEWRDICSVQSLSRVWLLVTKWTAHARAPYLSPTPRACSNFCPLSRWCHLILCHPFSSCLLSFPASGSFLRSQFFTSGGQSIGVSVSACLSNEYSGLISFRIDWFYLSPRDSQESSPTPQFKSINSSVLSILFSPTLTSIHDYWKSHSLD